MVTLDQVRTEIHSEIASSEARLAKRMDEGFAAVGESIETLSQQADDDQAITGPPPP